ncbi:hypothetical protein FACS1894161_2550 [Spirochaetia bacterium]|nr:hypothetical protein FACS1894161_2550 [Spirochaetia bacterium]
MAGVGGPFESHTINGRRFVCDAEDDAQIQLQGFSNEVKVAGDGSLRLLKSRIPGTLEGTNIIYDPFNGDDDYLVKCRSGKEMLEYSGTDVDGTIWTGLVQITGDLKFSAKNKTVGLTLTGTFEKQG